MDSLIPHTEITRVEFKNFLKGLDNLSEEQRNKLFEKFVRKYNPPVTIVLGGDNVINNSFAIQANGEASDVAEQLKNIPPELVASLTEAIAMWMRQNKSPS